MANKAISTLAVGSSVYLNVGGVRKEFLVVHQGKPSSMYDESCNGTWLLMKDIYEDRQWNSSATNYLEFSTIHSYLNSTFLNLFDSDIRDAIKQVKIPYRKNGFPIGTDQNGANGLPAKIFLLSGYEVGWTTSDNQFFPVDGAKLSYFESGTGTSANNKRIAKLDGSVSFWWLCSPYQGGNVWRVSPNGHYDSSNASYSNGIRPCIILPSTTLVDDSGNVVPVDLTAHKTLINGTAYEVKGGKCMVNGTVYSIKKGRTLIGGTGYDINFEPDVSLTWYFNETIDITSQPDNFWGYGNGSGIAVSFVSGYYGFTYDHLIRGYDDTYGVRTLIYYRKIYETRELAYRNGWKGQVYRTITFDELPTGDLLTWLQANATPQ
jgi:hypothetical protein